MNMPPVSPQPDDVPDTILEEAAEWYALLRSGQVSAQDQQRWRNWLNASPQHCTAWCYVEDIDRCFAPLKQTAEPRIAVDALVSANSRLQLRRRTLLSLGLVAGTGLLGASAWRQLSLPDTRVAWRADYRTATGEQREFTLPDGTAITLNTASAINVDYSSSRRRLVLVAGEVFISTAPDSQRPFVIDSIHGGMRALGTRFNVQQRAAETRLAVYEGAVEVRPGSGSEPGIIAAGSHTDFTRDAIGVPQVTEVTSPAWTRGILVADDLTLIEVVRELRRYHRGHIGVHQDIAQLKVYGSLPLDDTDKSLHMLANALPISVRETLPWWVSLEPR